MTELFKFLTLLTLIIQQKMLDDAAREEHSEKSGKLDAIEKASEILKKSRDPEERKNAAIALHAARKSRPQVGGR